MRGEIISDVDDPQTDLKRVYTEWVLDVKNRFNDRIIRRDLESKRWDGLKINEALPPRRVIVATCQLTEAEKAVLDAEVDSLGDS